MRLIDADAFEEYIKSDWETRGGFLDSDTFHKYPFRTVINILADIGRQPTVDRIKSTEKDARKITIFRPHEEIRIYVNGKMLADWVKCRRYLDAEQEPPDGICDFCELVSEIYPGAGNLCDVPEIRRKLKEWTGYGNEYE